MTVYTGGGFTPAGWMVLTLLLLAAAVMFVNVLYAMVCAERSDHRWLVSSAGALIIATVSASVVGNSGALLIFGLALLGVPLWYGLSNFERGLDYWFFLGVLVIGIAIISAGFGNQLYTPPETSGTPTPSSELSFEAVYRLSGSNYTGIALRNTGSREATLGQGGKNWTLMKGNEALDWTKLEGNRSTTIVLAPDEAVGINTTVLFPDAGETVVFRLKKGENVIAYNCSPQTSTVITC